MMNNETQARWDALENIREKFLAELDQWDPSMISARPSEGWSAIQVMEHILIAETGTLGYMKKKSSSGWDVLEAAGEQHNRISKAVNERLQSPERYSAPSVLPEPEGQSEYEQLKQQWKLLRNEMRSFIEGVDPVHYDRLVFRQPIAGMLNLLQAMEFMTYHIHHHIPQLQRIRESLS